MAKPTKAQMKELEKYGLALEEAVYESRWSLRYAALGLGLSIGALVIVIFSDNYGLANAFLVFSFITMGIGMHYRSRAERIEREGRPRGFR